MLPPDLLHTTSDPLRRLAWLHASVIAIGGLAIAWSMGSNFANGSGPFAIGAALLAALTIVAVLLIATWRIAQRELACQRGALESTNLDLMRSNSELEQFALVASHDLQEPLCKLVSFSELLRTDLGSELTDRAARDLEFITDAARRMRTLVKDLLTLSSTGTSEMQVRDVSLDGCVDRVLEALDLRISETHAVITRDPLPEVEGDPSLLEALYQNLLSNALKFVAPGSPPRIHLSAERGPDDTWVVGVHDEGIGIEPDRTPEIFRPFRRLHSNDKYPGTGIGLAIARKAVDRHGGRLWVESAKGAGSHFRFTLGGPERSVA